MDGMDNVRGLVAGDNMRFELSGDPDYKIMAGSMIRIYLWPLTIWSIQSVCKVQCIPKDAVSHTCGEVQNCEGIPTVLNSNNNVVKITMPLMMTEIEGKGVFFGDVSCLWVAFIVAFDL